MNVFKHAEGADHSYAEVLRATGDAPWAHEIAFVEHHRHDRLIVRGTFAGRYVNVDEEGDVIRKRTAEGRSPVRSPASSSGPPGLRRIWSWRTRPRSCRATGSPTWVFDVRR